MLYLLLCIVLCKVFVLSEFSQYIQNMFILIIDNYSIIIIITQFRYEEKIKEGKITHKESSQ